MPIHFHGFFTDLNLEKYNEYLVLKNSYWQKRDKIANLEFEHWTLNLENALVLSNKTNNL